MLMVHVPITTLNLEGMLTTFGIYLLQNVKQCYVMNITQRNQYGR